MLDRVYNTSIIIVSFAVDTKARELTAERETCRSRRGRRFSPSPRQLSSRLPSPPGSTRHPRIHSRPAPRPKRLGPEFSLTHTASHRSTMEDLLDSSFSCDDLGFDPLVSSAHIEQEVFTSTPDELVSPCLRARTSGVDVGQHSAGANTCYRCAATLPSRARLLLRPPFDPYSSYRGPLHHPHQPRPLHAFRPQAALPL